MFVLRINEIKMGIQSLLAQSSPHNNNARHWPSDCLEQSGTVMVG